MGVGCCKHPVALAGPCIRHVRTTPPPPPLCIRQQSLRSPVLDSTVLPRCFAPLANTSACERSAVQLETGVALRARTTHNQTGRWQQIATLSIYRLVHYFCNMCKT